MLESWVVRPGTDGPDVSLICTSTSARQEQRAAVRSTGQVDYWIEDKPLPFLPAPPRTLYLESWQEPSLAGARNELQLIATRLGLSMGVTQNLIRRLNENTDGAVANLRITHEGGTVLLRADVQGTHPGLPYCGLSHSEQFVLLVRLAALYANTTGTVSATLLLLDGGVVHLDSARLRSTVEFLLRAQQQFQSIIVLPRGVDWPRPWLGWEFVRIIVTAGRAHVEQGPE